MHRARSRTFAVATAVLAASLGLGGCSGTQPAGHQAAQPLPAPPVPDTRPDAAPLLHQVLERIDRAGSVRSQVQGDLGMAGELRSDGTVSYRSERADVALRGTTRMRDGKEQPLQVAVVGDDGYLKSPLLRPAPDKPWVRVSPGGTDFASRLFGPALDQLREASDPRTAFAGVESATKIQSRSEEQLDGKPVTRYDLRVVTERAAKLARDPHQRQRLARAAEKSPEQDYQLWLDPSGMPVRFSASKSVPQAGQVSLTSQYHDWGAPAEIQAPRPDQVGTLDSPAQAAQPPG